LRRKNGTKSAARAGLRVAFCDVCNGIRRIYQRQRPGGRGQEFTPTGTLVATYDSTTGSSETTGMCMDAAGNLYATMFTVGMVSKFDPNGTLVNANFAPGIIGSPESCQFNKVGELLVGTTAGRIHRYSATGTLLNTYSVSGGAGWIDLAADQCTVYYADDSPTVQRYNICTSTQLPVFANVGTVSGLRILPNGDVLASNRTSVARYNAPPGNSLIFAVTLDPDNTTFWTADLTNGNIFRYNLSPINNTPVTTFNSAQFVDTAGILVVGEITVGGPGGGGPSANQVPTTSTWALILLAILLGGAALVTVRRRAR
jgi:hypothetical protein